MTLPVVPRRLQSLAGPWFGALRAAVNAASSGGPGSDPEWGDIEGTLASQTDLQAALDGKAATAHTHVPANITGLVSPVIAYKSADQTNIGIAYADVTGTGFAVAANKAYAFEFVLWCTADAATTGIDVACNGPASPTAIRYEQVYWTTATARTERGAIAYDNNTASTGSQGTAARMFTVKGVLLNGANAGTLIARAKRENVGSGPNVLAGSYGILWPLD